MSCAMGGLRDSFNLAASSASDGRSRSQISPVIKARKHVGYKGRRVARSWQSSVWSSSGMETRFMLKSVVCRCPRAVVSANSVHRNSRNAIEILGDGVD